MSGKLAMVFQGVWLANYIHMNGARAGVRGRALPRAARGAIRP